MTELLTAAQMRAIEQAAIESGEVTGLELMERAGQGVVDAIFAEWPEFAPAAGAGRGASPSRSPEYLQQSESRRAVVLCGPGNNGGDGFVVARLLKEAELAVDVFLYGDPAKLPPDARVNYERWVEMGEVLPLSEKAFRAVDPGHHYATCYVDALFGTGISRPLSGDALDVLPHMAGRNGDDYPPYTVSIDAPSGLCLDSGRLLDRPSGGYAHTSRRFASLTVAFDSPKVGHLVGDGPTLCGKLKIVDIGLKEWRAFRARKPGEAAFARRPEGPIGVIRRPFVTLVTDKPWIDDLRDHVSALSLSDLGKAQLHGAHKYSHGHALILSGGVGKGGAARLVARGALRVGAGAITVGCPPAALIENAAHLNAIMLRPVADADALAEALADARLTAICIGPGLGLADREAALVKAALAKGGSHPPCVCLDADALTLLARDPALFAVLHAGCVLTPHTGEFARLFPDIAERLNAPATTGPAYSKVDATREAAKRAGCVVLFKGPDTVIADPSGRCSINASVYDRAAPWLATAGSGDVLAGFITGLLARGFDPMQAAETGAWLHTECARSFGPGLIAEDLPEELPKVFRALGVT